MLNYIIGLSYFLLAIITMSQVMSADLDDDYEGSGIENNSDWDVLIFTQQWPVTTCYHWMEESQSNTCNLPNKKEFWTIHGVWPTKYGKIGPSFCNKTAKFNPALLDNIRRDLDEFWPDIESSQETDSLWKHEWMKHGTCASSVPELSDEERYFGQGLDWRKRYLISDMLGNSGIHPDSSNTVINIQSALRKSLGKNPAIHCIYDRKKDASFLSEVRICFNKTLDLVDCDGVLFPQVAIDYPGGKVITNCHISKPVQYPSIVPPTKKDTWKFPFVNVYKLLNFVMWFTL